jgi:hypothetical protein
MHVFLLQIATQAGVLNVPQWYESGKIYAEAHPEVPQREHRTSSTVKRAT